MKNKTSKEKKQITVRVVNPPTKEEAKIKIKEIQKSIQLIYGGNKNEKD